MVAAADGGVVVGGAEVVETEVVEVVGAVAMAATAARPLWSLFTLTFFTPFPEPLPE